MNERKLSEREAYIAMHAFSENYYKQTKSDDVGALLGGMSLLSDGKTIDPAYESEWKDAIEKSLSGKHNILLKTEK